jgi:nitroimidazol reductase NimA-like FMN-containing flavoprotein (pyridoxamine 5'-phosphate oxidase superfamily)
MYGELNDHEQDELLKRHQFGRLGFSLEGEIFIIPINYAYDGARLYGHATAGTKVTGLRANPHVAFEVDEITDPAHWRSVLLQGRYVELHQRTDKEAAYQRILAQGGGGERSEVTWAVDIDHLVVFAIDLSRRSGRFEQREAYGLRPGPQGPLPPASIPPAQAGGDSELGR